MVRFLSFILAAILAANGLAMLFASLWWYDTVPGVTATGAFNPHLVRDVGMAYLVAAGGLFWFLWRPVEGWPALVGAAAFLTLHAAIHVFDASCSANTLSDVIRDFPGVYLPALVTAWLAAFRRPAQT